MKTITLFIILFLFFRWIWRKRKQKIRTFQPDYPRTKSHYNPKNNSSRTNLGSFKNTSHTHHTRIDHYSIPVKDFYFQRNWKMSTTFCRRCGQWKTNIQHRNCPMGSLGSITWIDIDSFQMGCNKCNSVWPLEGTTFYCSCGNIQRTEYADSAIVFESGDQVLLDDGYAVYVLKRSGTVVVGQRLYYDQGYID
jgi:hypothetical protein